MPADPATAQLFAVATIAMVRDGTPKRRVRYALAEKTGVSHRTVCRWMRGETRPGDDVIAILREVAK